MSASALNLGPVVASRGGRWNPSETCQGWGEGLFYESRAAVACLYNLCRLDLVEESSLWFSRRFVFCFCLLVSSPWTFTVLEKPIRTAVMERKTPIVKSSFLGLPKRKKLGWRGI